MKKGFGMIFSLISTCVMCGIVLAICKIYDWSLADFAAKCLEIILNFITRIGDYLSGNDSFKKAVTTIIFKF